jgi:hypothetical protein
MIIHCDGSVKFKPYNTLASGAAITWWENNQWEGRGFALSADNTHEGETQDVEMLRTRHKDELSEIAEVEAIGHAVDRIEDVYGDVDEVTIKSDGKSAISLVKDALRDIYHRRCDQVLSQMVNTIRLLAQSGVTIKFEWIRSHLPPTPNWYQAEGNRACDWMATYAANAAYDRRNDAVKWSGRLILYPETHEPNGEFGMRFNPNYRIREWRLLKPATEHSYEQSVNMGEWMGRGVRREHFLPGQRNEDIPRGMASWDSNDDWIWNG